MATLRAIFKLTDGYSKTIEKVTKKTDDASNKLMNASKHIDKFNNKLNSMGNNANKASNGLNKLVGAFVSLKAVQKTLSLADEMTLTSARLDLINDGLQTTQQLQDKIFASAQRSRGQYTSMASTVSKLGLLAGDAFNNNNEIIAFAETFQKMATVSGSSLSESTNAMYQLTQAMASGRLQGDEFRSIMENAPMLAQAIAKQMGKTTGELREMSSQGLITANVIKNAMFSATDEVNEKFAKMPMTFGQAWTIIQNSLLQSFLPIIQTIAKGAQFIGDNWGTLEPIFYGLAAAVGAYAIALGIQTVATWIANGAAKAFFATLMTNPLFWIALAVGVLVGLIYKWVKSVGGLKIAWMIAMNAILTAWDWVKIGFFTGIYWVLDLWDKLKLGIVVVSVAIANIMGDMKATVLTLLQGLVNGAIGIINGFINTLNKIPGVSIGLIEEVTFGTNAQLENEAAKQARNSALDAYTSDIASGIKARESKLSGMKEDAISATAQRQTEISAAQAKAFEEAGTANKPLIVEGTGANGSIGVSMADEDLQYLRDIAQRDYINKFSTATLAPNIQVSFGDVHEEADVDKVAGRIKKILQEEIATAAEGAYV